MGLAPSARFSLFSQARAFSADATIESSERNSRTKSVTSSHSFRVGSSRYFSANILETVGSLTPRVAATLDWLSARARAARITALVRTLRRSGARRGEGLRSAMIFSGKDTPYLFLRKEAGVTIRNGSARARRRAKHTSARPVGLRESA